MTVKNITDANFHCQLEILTVSGNFHCQLFFFTVRKLTVKIVLTEVNKTICEISYSISQFQDEDLVINFKGVPLNNYRQFIIKMYLFK